MRTHRFAQRAVASSLTQWIRNVVERLDRRLLIGVPTEDFAEESDPDGSTLRLSVRTSGIVRILSAIIVGLFVVDLIAQNMASLGIFDPHAMGVRQILRMLDLGAESSFGTWNQIVALSSLSMILGTIAVARRQVGDRYSRHWFFLAVLALGFSLDEQVRFHDPGGGTEVICDHVGLSGRIFYGWVMFGTLSVLAVWLIYRRSVADLPPTTGHLYRLAAALFIGGEIVMESITGWYADISGNEIDLIYQTLTSFEELFGMAGIFVAIAASLLYIQVHFGELLVALSSSAVAKSESARLVDPHFATAPSASQGLEAHDAMEAIDGGAAGGSYGAFR